MIKFHILCVNPWKFRTQRFCRIFIADIQLVEYPVPMNDQKLDPGIPVTTWWQRISALLAPTIQRFAVVVAVGFLLGLLSRQGWIFDLASNFRFQCLLAFAGIFFVLFAFRRWRWAAFVGVMLAWSGSHFVDSVIAPAGTAEASRRQYRAMHLNLYVDNEQAATVLDLIRRESPDFVLFQELTPRLLGDLESLRSEYPHVANYARDWVNGQAVFSKWPIIRKDFREPDGGWYWGYLTVELQLPEAKLIAFAIHPTPPMSDAMWNGRNEVLGEVGKQAAATVGPMMIIGDFNCTPYSAFFQELKSISGTRDSRTGRGILATWPSKYPAFMRIPIDHCLVSKELTVVDRRVGEACGSDHQSIIVDFQFQESPPGLR